jgi:hypothetical protein
MVLFGYLDQMVCFIGLEWLFFKEIIGFFRDLDLGVLVFLLDFRAFFKARLDFSFLRTGLVTQR